MLGEDVVIYEIDSEGLGSWDVMMVACGVCQISYWGAGSSGASISSILWQARGG